MKNLQEFVDWCLLPEVSEFVLKFEEDFSKLREEYKPLANKQGEMFVSGDVFGKNLDWMYLLRILGNKIEQYEQIHEAIHPALENAKRFQIANKPIARRENKNLLGILEHQLANQYMMLKIFGFMDMWDARNATSD